MARISRAPGNRDAVSAELHAVDPEVLLEHTSDLDLERRVTPGSGRQLARIGAAWA